MEKICRKARAGDREAAKEQDLLERVKVEVERGTSVRALAFTQEEQASLSGLGLLTEKPVLFVANVAEENGYSTLVEELARKRNAGFVVIRGELEMEIAETAETEEERAAYRGEWGMEDSGLERLIQAGYHFLRLITFFTTDGPEVRAWTVKQGTKCPQAGAKIHTDFEKRFIQAEVVPVGTLLEHGSPRAVKEAGLLQRAGEEYEVRDGDVIHFVVA